MWVSTSSSSSSGVKFFLSPTTTDRPSEIFLSASVFPSVRPFVRLSTSAATHSWVSGNSSIAGSGTEREREREDTYHTYGEETGTDDMHEQKKKKFFVFWLWLWTKKFSSSLTSYRLDRYLEGPLTHYYYFFLLLLLLPHETGSSKHQKEWKTTTTTGMKFIVGSKFAREQQATHSLFLPLLW